MVDLSPLVNAVAKLKSRMDAAPTFRWGVVTSVSPLKVQLDADTTPLAGTPDTLVAGLSVGQRVQCLLQHRRVTVIGVGGGTPAGVVDWDDVQDKPSTFPPAAHTHAAADIDSGTLSTARLPTVPISKGGTGATTAAAARAALGLPYAEAGGILAATSVPGNSDKIVTITFPAGRFTQPPIVTATINATGARERWIDVYTVTATSCQLLIGNSVAGAQTIGAMWHAYQATSGSAEG